MYWMLIASRRDCAPRRLRELLAALARVPVVRRAAHWRARRLRHVHRREPLLVGGGLLGIDGARLLQVLLARELSLLAHRLRLRLRARRREA